MVLIVVGVLVVLALDGGILAVKVLVLQLARDGAGAPRLHIGDGRIDGVVGAVGFRAGCHENDGIGQREPGFRQTHHVGCVHCRLDDGDDLRVCKAHVLTGADHQPAAGRGQVARFQQTGQIVEGGVGVGAAHGLLVGRHDVVVVVAVPVVPHGRAAGDLLYHLEGDVLSGSVHGGRRHHEIETAQRLAQVAARTLGEVGAGVLVHHDRL